MINKKEIVFVIKASKVVRNSLSHKRSSTGDTKDRDVWRPLKRGCISILRRNIDVLEWGVRVWLSDAE